MQSVTRADNDSASGMPVTVAQQLSEVRVQLQQLLELQKRDNKKAKARRRKDKEEAKARRRKDKAQRRKDKAEAEAQRQKDKAEAEAQERRKKLELEGLFARVDNRFDKLSKHSIPTRDPKKEKLVRRLARVILPEIRKVKEVNLVNAPAEEQPNGFQWFPGPATADAAVVGAIQGSEWQYSMGSHGLMILRRAMLAVFNKVERFRLEQHSKTSGGTILSGSPGVGKTTFMNFALIKWLKTPSIKEIVLHRTNSQTAVHIVRRASKSPDRPQFDVYNVPNACLQSVLDSMYRNQVAAATADAKTNTASVYACDTASVSGHPLDYDGWTFVTASPNRGHYANLLKIEQPHMVYMPLWDYQSLVDSRTLMSTAAPEASVVCATEADVRARFQAFNGIFRHVLTGSMDQWLSQQDSALAEVSLKNIGTISRDLKNAGDVSHRLFVMQPLGYLANGDEDRASEVESNKVPDFTVDFVSARVIDAFAEKTLRYDSSDIEDIVAGENSATAALRGICWQRAVLFRMRGGDALPTYSVPRGYVEDKTAVSFKLSVSCRQLQPKTGSPGGMEQLVWSVSQVAELPSSTKETLSPKRTWSPHDELLVIPLAGNYPLCDAFLFQMEKEQPVIWLVQLTIAPKHKVQGWSQVRKFLETIDTASPWCPAWVTRRTNECAPHVRLVIVTPYGMMGICKYLISPQPAQKRKSRAKRRRGAKGAEFLSHVQQFVAGCTWERSTKYLWRSASSSSPRTTGSPLHSSDNTGSRSSASSSTMSTPPGHRLIHSFKRKRKSPISGAVDQSQRSAEQLDRPTTDKPKRPKTQRKK